MADGGEGTMQSLGGKLMDKNGKEIGFGGGELGKLKKINLTDFDERLNDVKVEIACDVDNPLCGRKGASNVLILKKEQHQRWLKSLMII